jgi:hypothetical protein
MNLERSLFEKTTCSIISTILYSAKDKPIETMKRQFLSKAGTGSK